jgi:lipopolysaccharide transport system ATP-binding protein
VKPIIKVNRVSKRYRVGEGGISYLSLRESLVNRITGPFRSQHRRPAKDDFWALRDISFEVQPGEIVGLIGKNGAGKSTMLKLLSRITRPTTGRIELRGRVGSLLEVGTGFHPELTGRDNIFLNGAILGMRRTEIVSKFDEIVDFSGVEKFIDTPVKRYSSGMYVRLAFAVAAHLQPEILLIDEVLAVGDAEFQKKCLGKMGEVSRAGRTVLFISHNITAIESLCDRCLLLEGGTMVANGETDEVVAGYLASIAPQESGTVSLMNHQGRTGRSDHSMTSVTLAADGAEPASAIRMGGRLAIKVGFDCVGPVSPKLGIVIKNANGVAIFDCNSFIAGYHLEERIASGTISCMVNDLPLVPGVYSIDLRFGDGLLDSDLVHDAISLEVLPADVFGTGHLPNPGRGVIYWPASFAVTGGSESGCNTIDARPVVVA